MNIIGIALLIWSEALDSADGQLARMTNKKSKIGRILDGFATNLWFLSIYIFLCLRLINSGESYFVLVIALFCGISHSLQSAMADYYRNHYLFFVYGKNRSEVDNSKKLQQDYKELGWGKDFVTKLFMRLYINYTLEQEVIAANSKELINCISTKYNDEIPEEISREFKEKIND
jgi:hypothetical protein